jgi:hypothetical protein
VQNHLRGGLCYGRGCGKHHKIPIRTAEKTTRNHKKLKNRKYFVPKVLISWFLRAIIVLWIRENLKFWDKTQNIKEKTKNILY